MARETEKAQSVLKEFFATSERDWMKLEPREAANTVSRLLIDAAGRDGNLQSLHHDFKEARLFAIRYLGAAQERRVRGRGDVKDHEMYWR